MQTRRLGNLLGDGRPLQCKGRSPKHRTSYPTPPMYRTQVTIISDNTRVWRQLRGIQLGRKAERVHQADWGQVENQIHRPPPPPPRSTG